MLKNVCQVFYLHFFGSSDKVIQILVYASMFPDAFSVGVSPAFVVKSSKINNIIVSPIVVAQSSLGFLP